MYVGADGKPLTSDASQARGGTSTATPAMPQQDGGVAAARRYSVYRRPAESAQSSNWGHVDPDTGEYTYEGIGAFHRTSLIEPRQVQELGVSAVDASTGRYDPQRSGSSQRRRRQLPY